MEEKDEDEPLKVIVTNQPEQKKEEDYTSDEYFEIKVSKEEIEESEEE